MHSGHALTAALDQIMRYLGYKLIIRHFFDFSVLGTPPMSPRPAGDLLLPPRPTSRDLSLPFALSPPPDPLLASPPAPRPSGDRESSSSRLSRRDRLRRRSLSEEDELDELDELERPITLAPD